MDSRRDRQRLRRRLAVPLIVASFAALLSACAERQAAAPHLTLDRSGFDRLDGWQRDHVAEAVPAFLKSCAVFLARAPNAPFSRAEGGDPFGRVADWRPACAEAAALPPADDAAARQFFEARFEPFLAGSNGEPEGLFTGYFEITLHGSRRCEGPFQTPIYRRPPDPEAYTRAQIEDGALAGQGLELLWLDDPIAAFFLEIQGSGRVELAGGGTAEVGYDGSNGKPYVAVGRLLVERGMIPREKMSMQAIRDWMVQHPKEGMALRRENPSYVFFKENPTDGAVGAEGIVLTPLRSLAVDRAYIPLGVPLWLDAQQRYEKAGVSGLVIAQDVGGQIKGPVRGDLFWGAGEAAAAAAGKMNAKGKYYVLLPRDAVTRRVSDRDLPMIPRP